MPLKPADDDALLDLQATLNRLYDEARYAIRIDYSESPPAPALPPDEQSWSKSVVAANE